MILYPDIFSYLVFNPSELGSNNLSDYKNCKAYSYYMSGRLQPLMYYNLTGSKFCIFKVECRNSQSINNPFHKFWLIVEKTGKIRACHCTCMAGMGQSCNHVAAAMFRVEAAVRNGLTNPSCTSSSNEWLPCRKEVEPSKIKNFNFNQDGFGDRGKQKRSLVSRPKKNFQPLASCSRKLLNLNDFADALKTIAPNSIVHTAVPQQEIDFEVKSVTLECNTKSFTNVSGMLIEMSGSNSSFFQNLKTFMASENISKIEAQIRGQNQSQQWYACRKGVITASKVFKNEKRN